jgi:hypothetical protein
MALLSKRFFATSTARRDSAQGSNGAKLGRIWDGFCPEGAIGLSPGFQPWETSKQMVRPERARDAYTFDLRCGDV